jgi:hypothetical protein
MGGSVLGPASFDLTLSLLCGKIQYSPLSTEKLTTKKLKNGELKVKDLVLLFHLLSFQV